MRPKRESNKEIERESRVNVMHDIERETGMRKQIMQMKKRKEVEGKQCENKIEKKTKRVFKMRQNKIASKEKVERVDEEKQQDSRVRSEKLYEIREKIKTV